MAAICRFLSVTLLVGALLASLAMLGLDLEAVGLHAHHAALPLALIGSSYACLQLSARRPTAEMVKGLLLGWAFILWGVELVMPPGRTATLIDCLVVLIFVLDLGFIIVEHLRRRDHLLP